MSATVPTAIPAPPEFPVSWENPADAGLFWQREQVHFPHPATRMEEASFAAGAHGFTAALAAFDAPIAAMRMRTVNGYLYTAIEPALGTPEEMAARAERGGERMRAAIARLGECWEQETLPELKGHLEWWESFDLRGSSLAAFVAHWDETWERAMRLSELHFYTVIPVYTAMSEFDELYRDLFGESEALDSYRLLEGIPNKTVEVAQAMWRLSRRALADPVVRSVLECEASERVIGALRESAAGREFLADLDAYLSRYGMRSDMWGLGAPSWIEDPTPVIRNLRDYIGRPDGDAPAVRTRRAAEGRERAIAEARERLAVYPAMVVEQFEALLEAAQIATVLSEDHGFWIDCAGTYRERMVILEAGRRLAEAGVLGDAGDVFHLSPAEVRASLVAGRTRDRRALVAQRIDEIARRRALDPPAVLGSMPPGPPPESPFSRAMMKFIGMPAGPSETPGELTGSAGSKGTVRGPARIIRSISEADRVRPGDVLVAETTAPPWTPLFATVAAVVTDTGGVLSHCAVVAREYGIPAVVGVGVATQAIADGQLIEVDGDAGVVRIIGD